MNIIRVKTTYYDQKHRHSRQRACVYYIIMGSNQSVGMYAHGFRRAAASIYILYKSVYIILL